MLTATNLYEIKQTLTRDSLFEAIGQLFMYKQAAQFSGIISIIAGSYEKGVVNLLTHTEKLGIEVLIWEGIKLMSLLEYHKDHYGSIDQEQDQD
jgi:hypothetical protein